jgi:alkylation response protein AidB-like acyl-CoA dehydrogenase
MVHYLLATDEQRQFADVARKILEKELAPRISELEQAHGAEAFPRDVVETLAKAGYCGLGIPERFGGMGLDYKTRALIFEEMAQIDAGFSFSFALGCSAPGKIEFTAMPMEEKQMWYDRCMNGEAIFAAALTEPGAGSDTKAIRTTAVQDGGEWVINGTKCFITNGGIADAVTVSAYIDKSKGAAGIGQFFIEKERGFEVGKIEDKMGLKLSVTSELYFDEVRVPLDHQVGSVYTLAPEDAKQLPPQKLGNANILEALAVSRIANMVHALGIGQRALDESVKYAKERRQFGKRIFDHEGLGFMIAGMQRKVDAARALLYYGLDCLDIGVDVGTLSPSTKVQVSESMMEVCVDAVQVHGGYGYMKDFPVEKLMRDIKIFSIFEGTNQINELVAARMLSGRDPQAERPAR